MGPGPSWLRVCVSVSLLVLAVVLQIVIVFNKTSADDSGKVAKEFRAEPLPEHLERGRYLVEEQRIASCAMANRIMPMRAACRCRDEKVWVRLSRESFTTGSSRPRDSYARISRRTKRPARGRGPMHNLNAPSGMASAMMAGNCRTICPMPFSEA